MTWNRATVSRVARAMRLVVAALAVSACAKPPAPAAPALAPAPLAVPDADTALWCAPVDAAADAALLVRCAPGGGDCAVAYTPAHVAAAWRVRDAGEQLHVDVLDHTSVVLAIDGWLAQAAGTEATVSRIYVGVVRTPGAGAIRSRRSPSPTCALSTDLHE